MPFPYVSVRGNLTSPDSHNESPWCSPFGKSSLSLGLSLVGPYSPRGSSSPVVTLELEPLDDPSPHQAILWSWSLTFP